ncbi:conserved membrane protein of unknown function (plasmid) [Rhodovastum atsumiense]|uniref:Type IV secretion system protein n=1 Tax=Rhodovastum atsumiense TaxID=504468 RepID=A0A5M6IMW9_9PROT|nr:type IV secretion system protein [Rhodovastum atsumiense]KAA5609596.1 hypothetical protein F1189_23515 [Rhodovastum atsumiense]CAH2606362.1 conserved membrane protein of unknown function [Rhodovastum atsumiense]
MAESGFLDLTTHLDTVLIDGVGEAVQGLLAGVRAPLAAALSLLVMFLGLEAMVGNASARRFAMTALKAAFIVTLLRAENYVPYIQEAALTTVPAELARWLNGPGVQANAARQFDVLAEALKHAAALLLVQLPGVLNSVNRGLVHGFGIVGSGGIYVMCLLWYLPRILLGIVIVLGPCLIPFFLFHATRAYAESWVGKVVALTVLQLAAAVLVRLLLVAITHRMLVLQASAAAGDEGLWTFAGMTGLMWFGALMMAVLPLAITVGSGIGAASTAIFAYTAAAARMPVRTTAAAARLARR